MTKAAKPYRHSTAPTRASTWAQWYQEPGWRQRSKAHLDEHPLCVACKAEGLTVVATVADHIEPHKGNRGKFECGALQSLCRRHSNAKTGRGE
jgi:hypothetical protein